MSIYTIASQSRKQAREWEARRSELKAKAKRVRDADLPKLLAKYAENEAIREALQAEAAEREAFRVRDAELKKLFS